MEKQMTCCQRYDAWLWNTPGCTQEEKAENHIKAHHKISTRCLFIFRVISALILAGHAVGFFINWSSTETGLHLPLVYFTNWSLYVTTTYFVLVSVSYIRRAKSEAAQSTRSCCGPLWKWSSYLFLLSFTCNMMTTVLFWLLLYPRIEDKSKLKYGFFSLHGGPLVLSLIDFAFNRIVVERNHWVLTVKFGFAYSVMLVIFTKSSDEDDHFIYPMFKLKTIGSWILLAGNGVFGLLVHFAIYGFSKCKYACCCPRKDKDSTIVKPNVESSQSSI